LRGKPGCSSAATSSYQQRGERTAPAPISIEGSTAESMGLHERAHRRVGGDGERRPGITRARIDLHQRGLGRGLQRDALRAALPTP
jgi:hypothetical protein